MRFPKNISFEIDALTKFFGNENLRKGVMQSTNDTSDNLFVTDAVYKNIIITHIPTGIQTIGDSSDNITENLWLALSKLKEEVKRKI